MATEQYGIQEESEDIVSDCCRTGSINVHAQKNCVDCGENLCKLCSALSTKLSVTRHQAIISIQRLHQMEDEISKKDTYTEICQLHPNETIKFFCKNHVTLVCRVCISVNHRTCNHVEYIPELANYLTNDTELRESKLLLQRVNNKSGKVSRKIEGKIKTLDISCSEIVREIRDYRLKINDLLDKLENDLLMLLDQYKKHNMEVLNHAFYTCKEIHGETETILADNENLRARGKNHSLFDRSFMLKERVEELDRRLSNVDDTLNVKESMFKPNLTFIETIKGLNGIGELKEVVLEPVKCVPESFVPCGNLNARSTMDSLPCKITSCVTLPDGISLILSDYNNQKVKKYNIQDMSLKSEVHVPGRPWDLVVIEDANVAVTVPYDKKILFIKVGKELGIERDILLGGECHGLAEYKKNTLIVTYGNLNKLEMMNFGGNVLASICNQQNQPMMFKKPLYVTSNPKTDMLYVSNFSDNSVVCLKLDGSFVWKYTDSQLSGPLNIAVESSGIIYVCGKRSHNIHQISADCKQDRVCVAGQDLEKQPYSICYNERYDRFYVGILDNDNLKVFQPVRDVP